MLEEDDMTFVHLADGIAHSLVKLAQNFLFK
ncbi:hypothetical protein SDC9_153642 [bioreactor metagenome]|uniref:Uncharacterized protein n=1 Tax=bioreactor metagenome TaxID=1076179 RepID=A0A645EY86_9ZZZZ